MKNNVIQFPVSKRIKDELRDDAFQFHKQRINKLLHELQYEFFRAYENPKLQIELRVYEQDFNKPRTPKINIWDFIDGKIPDRTE